MKNFTNSNRFSVLYYILLSIFAINISSAQCTLPDDADPLHIVTPIPTTTTSAKFTWDPAVPDTDGNYQWEIRTTGAPGNSATAGYVLSGNAPSGTTTITIYGLKFTTVYYFYVRFKCNAGGFSDWQSQSIDNQFTTTAMLPPIATAAISVYSDSFIAKWNPVFGSSYYKLDVSTKNGTFPNDFDSNILTSYDDLTVNNIYKEVTGLTSTEPTPYYYRVRAIGNNGSGDIPTANSNIITVTTTDVDEDTTTWNGTEWSNYEPYLFVNAIIDGPYNTKINGTIECNSLTVNAYSGSGPVPKLTIESVGTGSTDGRYVIAYGPVINLSGTDGIVIKSNGNLIQSGAMNFENVGDITVERDSNPLWRLDYTMWSSPVKSSQTLQQFSPQTLSDRFYTYNTVTDKFSFIPSPSTSTFDTGSGYLIRMPNDYKNNPGAAIPVSPTGPAKEWTGVFTGVPNGDDGTAISINNASSANGYYMIGNPYPSTVNATSFINGNLSGNKIKGALYFWRRTNVVGGGGAYNTFYATWTKAGGSGTGQPVVGSSITPNGLIAKGQGFIVQANLGVTVANRSVKFTNDMRIETYPPQFMKKANNRPVTEQNVENDGLERNRLWLNVSSSTGDFGQTLLAYMTDATNGLDDADGEYINDGAFALTSLVDSKEYIIQARALPFNDADVVAMLFKTPNAGDFTITLDQMDGLFADGQAIFIKDNLTKTTHNLNEKPYNFSSVAGVFPARFEIVYQASSLSTNNPTIDANSVVVYKSNQAININSGALAMKSVELYDMSGRMIYKTEKVDNTKVAISNLNFQDQIIIIKITTEAGIVNKKFSWTK